MEAADEEDEFDGVSDPASDSDDSAPCDTRSASERDRALWISSTSPLGRGRDLHLPTSNGPILRASQMQVSGYFPHNSFVSFVLQYLVDIYGG